MKRKPNKRKKLKLAPYQLPDLIPDMEIEQAPVVRDIEVNISFEIPKYLQMLIAAQIGGFIGLGYCFLVFHFALHLL